MILHNVLEFISNNTHIRRELLLKKSKQFSEGVTPEKYYTLFQTSSNTYFLESYWQTTLYNFPELPSVNTDIFKELLANNTTKSSRVHIKQYWNFKRVTG